MSVSSAASMVFHTPITFTSTNVAEDLAAITVAAEPDDACVGDHDVEAAEFANALLDDLLQRIGIADVGLVSDDLSAFVLDELDGFVELVRSGVGVVHRVDVAADVHRDDVSAFGG